MPEPTAPRRWTEAERLAALERTQLLDTPPEQAFDDLVRLAAELTGAPMAAIHLVDRDRQWAKAETGLGAREMPRSAAICPTAMLDPEGLVVPDASLDPRFADSPVVRGMPGIRFYAGVPLQFEGVPIGALCVLDTAPREGLDGRQSFALRALAAQVNSQIALRRALADRDRAERLHRQTLNSAADYAIISMDMDGRVIGWNTGAENVLGWSEAEMLGEDGRRIFVEEDRRAGRPEEEMRTALVKERSPDERWHLHKDGSRFWASGEMMPLRDADGGHVGFVKVLRDRTGQRLAAEALEAVNERYRLAARATNDAIWDWDLQRNEVGWNEALGSAFGWRPEQVEPTGEWWIGNIHPEDRARIDGSIHAVIDGGGTSWSGEYRFRRADGSYAAVLDRGYVTRDAGGTPVRMIGAMLDLTARAEAERGQREAEERLRLAADAARIGTFDFRVREGVLNWDDRCRELFGLPPGVPVSYEGSFLAGLHPQDRARADAAVQRALDPAGSGHFEAEYRTLGITDGVERWVSASGEASFRDGAPVRLIGTVLDISARKRAEEALQRLNATLEQQVAERTADRNRLWQLSADIVMVARFDGTVTAVNPALTTMLGWAEGELVGQSFLSLVHPEEEARVREGMAGLRGGGAPWRFDIRVRDREGRYRWIAWAAVPGGGLVNAVGRDVTAEREAAEALARAEESLRQSAKMEAVGQLTGGIAHDFNNLLTGITGSLELLGTRIAQGRMKDVDRYVTAAQGAAKRAAALTHRLLAFSRQQTLDPRPTEVNRLIAGMEELVRRTVGPEIAVEVVPAAGLWPTLVDPNQLENALLNLCINARDAMPEGGRITIETANHRVDERGGAERGLPAGHYVALSVSDTGTGMAPEVVARAFEPFFTTKPMGQGTGLGLSMIYGFVRQSGGGVRAYSEPGQGTTMCLYLPRHDGETEFEVEAARPDLPRTGAGETVLVVDDEATVRMLVAEVLEEFGYAAVEAADGFSGLKVLQSDLRIDLLITDVGLPGGMNGRQLADAARALRPALKVLFITGYAENAALGNGRLEPGMHVLTKPFAMEALATRIREVIGGA
ncbi:PAS domain S-box protein [Roseomonas indoligenes]|uniref:histidine kinase n=1 Tax=Roseomonas indoligenes TaxID=2820811 RepID=A0A940S6Y3_9PROT|nr:PAS domain S-box protein [Pararoseomonas indoligenes]MBP0492522.1 PAS domain S-box protein [Pararoseomonas indoligenes]